MNKVILTETHVTADATYVAGQNGQQSRANFSVGQSKRGKDNEADFFPCVAFGSLADYINRGMAEGRFLQGCKVELSGQIHNNNYTDKNGVKHYGDQIVLDSCFSWKREGAQGQAAQGAPAQATYQGTPAQTYQAPAQAQPQTQPAYQYQGTPAQYQQAYQPAYQAAPAQATYQGTPAQTYQAPAQTTPAQTAGFAPGGYVPQAATQQAGGYIPAANALPPAQD